MSETSINQPTEKFFVAGIITRKEFQKCRFITTKLRKCFPKDYDEPDIRSMLDVEWEEYLTKKRRKYGKGIWSLRRRVMVFLNNELLGDDKDLLQHVSKKYRFGLKMDWYEIGRCHLVDYLKGIMNRYRQVAYLIISIDHKVIGTLVFELYNDLVPLACENFLDKCKAKANGYSRSPIQRILKNSWIQCGGWELSEKKMRCENYVVPHDRRGVLCMCNNGRHKDNTTQFFVTLASTPWMDYRYVAFGQLIQGADILKQIEEVPTQYESPIHPIIIAMSGEVTFDRTPDFLEPEELQEFRDRAPSVLLDNLIAQKSGDLTSSCSLFSERKFAQGKYCLHTDMRSYLPFLNFVDYMMPAIGEHLEKDISSDDGEGSDQDHDELLKAFFDTTPDPCTNFNSPTFSDTTI
ncbi:hypothetical protein JTB14_000076 [Gonioctena quinquepunctata]|nr:hypothetical protein JTB14_000076 [Gonioctena quinquepunctata]